MRITNLSLSNRVSEGVQASFQRLAKVQESVSSGKRINRLSDDAYGAVRTIDLRGYSASLDQYDRNIDSALPQLALTDTVLADVSDALSRAKSLAVSLANDSFSAQDRLNGATEVHEVLSQLLALANTKFDSRYIFAGFKNDATPFTDSGTGIVYNGDNGELKTVTGPSTTLTVNLRGNTVFQGVGVTGGVDLFDAVQDLEAALSANDVTGPDGNHTQLGRLESAMEQVISQRAEVGARVNTAEAAKDSLDLIQLRTTTLRSQIEDADAIQVYSDLARQQYAFDAALQSATRVLQPSILDFLQ